MEEVQTDKGQNSEGRSQNAEYCGDDDEGQERLVVHCAPENPSTTAKMIS